jgi:hypothetical protein
MPKSVVVVALVLAALTTGCGEAPEPSTRGVGSDPPAKQEFVERADAICLRMAEASAAEAARLRTDPDAALQRALELQGRMIRELRALTPPPGDEAKIGAVLLHLDRLQAAIRALGTIEGEEVLGAVAAIGVETDAVARAAHRYGIFRRCAVYRENPGIQRILRGQSAPRGSDVEPSKPRTAPPSPVVELRRLASMLVPPGRTVLRRQDCTGGDRPSPPCVTIELAPSDRPPATRRAEIAALARRHGWTQPKPTAGEWPAGLLALHRENLDATVWLAQENCRPGVRLGDGPTPQAVAMRCLDTILLTAFR